MGSNRLIFPQLLGILLCVFLALSVYGYIENSHDVSSFNQSNPYLQASLPSATSSNGNYHDVLNTDTDNNPLQLQLSQSQFVADFQYDFIPGDYIVNMSLYLLHYDPRAHNLSFSQCEITGGGDSVQTSLPCKVSGTGDIHQFSEGLSPQVSCHFTVTEAIEKLGVSCTIPPEGLAFPKASQLTGKVVLRLPPDTSQSIEYEQSIVLYGNDVVRPNTNAYSFLFSVAVHEPVVVRFAFSAQDNNGDNIMVVPFITSIRRNGFEAPCIETDTMCSIRMVYDHYTIFTITIQPDHFYSFTIDFAPREYTSTTSLIELENIPLTWHIINGNPTEQVVTDWVDLEQPFQTGFYYKQIPETVFEYESQLELGPPRPVLGQGQFPWFTTTIGPIVPPDGGIVQPFLPGDSIQLRLGSSAYNILKPHCTLTPLGQSPEAIVRTVSFNCEPIYLSSEQDCIASSFVDPDDGLSIESLMVTCQFYVLSGADIITPFTVSAIETLLISPIRVSIHHHWNSMYTPSASSDMMLASINYSSSDSIPQESPYIQTIATAVNADTTHRPVLSLLLYSSDPNQPITGSVITFTHRDQNIPLSESVFFITGCYAVSTLAKSDNPDSYNTPLGHHGDPDDPTRQFLYQITLPTSNSGNAAKVISIDCIFLSTSIIQKLAFTAKQHDGEPFSHIAPQPLDIWPVRNYRVFPITGFEIGEATTPIISPNSESSSIVLTTTIPKSSYILPGDELVLTGSFMDVVSTMSCNIHVGNKHHLCSYNALSSPFTSPDAIPRSIRCLISEKVPISPDIANILHPYTINWDSLPPTMEESQRIPLSCTFSTHKTHQHYSSIRPSVPPLKLSAQFYTQQDYKPVTLQYRSTNDDLFSFRVGQTFDFDVASSIHWECGIRAEPAPGVVISSILDCFGSLPPCVAESFDIEFNGTNLDKCLKQCTIEMKCIDRNGDLAESDICFDAGYPLPFILTTIPGECYCAKQDGFMINNDTTTTTTTVMLSQSTQPCIDGRIPITITAPIVSHINDILISSIIGNGTKKSPHVILSSSLNSDVNDHTRLPQSTHDIQPLQSENPSLYTKITAYYSDLITIRWAFTGEEDLTGIIYMQSPSLTPFTSVDLGTVELSTGSYTIKLDEHPNIASFLFIELQDLIFGIRIPSDPKNPHLKTAIDANIYTMRPHEQEVGIISLLHIQPRNQGRDDDDPNTPICRCIYGKCDGSAGTCICDNGYSGALCQYKPDDISLICPQLECVAENTHPYAECIVTTGQNQSSMVTCNCLDRFSGDHCEHEKACGTRGCSMGRLLSPSGRPDECKCHCNTEYIIGETCNQCRLPCQNGGVANTRCTQCECKAGYIGLTCNIPVWYHNFTLRNLPQHLVEMIIDASSASGNVANQYLALLQQTLVNLLLSDYTRALQSTFIIINDGDNDNDNEEANNANDNRIRVRVELSQFQTTIPPTNPNAPYVYIQLMLYPADMTDEMMEYAQKHGLDFDWSRITNNLEFFRQFLKDQGMNDDNNSSFTPDIDDPSCTTRKCQETRPIDGDDDSSNHSFSVSYHYALFITSMLLLVVTVGIFDIY